MILTILIIGLPNDRIPPSHLDIYNAEVSKLFFAKEIPLVTFQYVKQKIKLKKSKQK